MNQVRLYTNEALPKVWQNYLEFNNAKLLTNETLLILLNNTKENIIKWILDWLQDQNIQPIRKLTVNGNTMIIILTTNDAAMMKLAMP